MIYGLLNKLTAKPGERGTVVEILLESGNRFTGNPACLMYMVSEAADDPSVIWVTDLWTGKQEHAEALKDPELKPYIQRATPLLERMPEQIEINPRGGLGVPTV